MTKFIDFLKKIQEESPTNTAGGGQVAGLGVGAQGEPGRKAVMKKMIKRKLPNVTNK